MRALRLPAATAAAFTTRSSRRPAVLGPACNRLAAAGVPSASHRRALRTFSPAAMAPPPWADFAASTSPDTATAALAAAAASVPPLHPARYKGQAGRVAIIGGCAEYTGAPFFAAMAALRTGADLAHVFCTPGAAPVIKSYAPDLIVHPALQDGPGGDATASLAAIAPWLPRFDAVIVGPGLGKDPSVAGAAAAVVRAVVGAGTAGLVLDGDVLALAGAVPDLVTTGCGSAAIILTPNAAEFGRLAAACGLGDGAPAGPPGEAAADSAVRELAARLAGPTVLLKGSADRIAVGGAGDGASWAASIAGRGSPRRAGGQGDVLSGAAATFLAWGVSARRVSGGGGGRAGDGRGGGGGGGEAVSPVPPAAAAAAAGAALTRAAAARAFSVHGRAMVAADVLAEVGAAFQELFEK